MGRVVGKDNVAQMNAAFGIQDSGWTIFTPVTPTTIGSGNPARYRIIRFSSGGGVVQLRGDFETIGDTLATLPSELNTLSGNLVSTCSNSQTGARGTVQIAAVNGQLVMRELNGFTAKGNKIFLGGMLALTD